MNASPLPRHSGDMGPRAHSLLIPVGKAPGTAGGSTLRARTIGVLGILTFVGAGLVGAQSDAGADQQGGGEPVEAYSLTLEIVNRIPSCNDPFSSPEYYASAVRDDPAIEEELDVIRDERRGLSRRITELDKQIEPLARREHRTEPLSDTERNELEALRQRYRALGERIWEEGRQMSSEERDAADGERAELAEAVQRLEDRIPLRDEEAQVLRFLREEQEIPKEERRVLDGRRRELISLVSMRAPGSLRVYPEDSVRVRLMEEDAFSDDVCATWNITLDRKTLDERGMELERRGRPILRVWIRRDSP